MTDENLEDRVLEVVQEHDGVRLNDLVAAVSGGEPKTAAKTKREALRLIDQGRILVDYEYKLRLASPHV